MLAVNEETTELPALPSPAGPGFFIVTFVQPARWEVMARMKVEYEPLNGIQPWAVYKVAGREKQHCASFSTKQKALDWVKKYGDRNINH